jgi:hypothetical protein
MSGNTGVVRERLAVFAELNSAANRAVALILEESRGFEAGDGEAAEVMFEVAKLIGQSEQARHGQLVQVLAQADRACGRKGVLKPWVATQLDVTDSKARGIAQSAKLVGAVPELSDTLSSGNIGADTIRALARTAKAIKGTEKNVVDTLTEMLQLAERDGVTAVNREIRKLEHHLDPVSSEEVLAGQRARSFLRFVELEDGRCRVEGLLDPERATIVRGAVDQVVSAVIRERQYDGAEVAPEDVRTTEQFNAHALVRLAEVFLNADVQARGSNFTPQILFTMRLDGDGLAETVYGTQIPASVLPKLGDAGTHLLHLGQDGEPVLLDWVNIDADPDARLASPAQRTALAHRDRHCSYAGCARPPTWSLHAHHGTAFSKGGRTVVENLTLLCSEHHVLVHQIAA